MLQIIIGKIQVEGTINVLYKDSFEVTDELMQMVNDSVSKGLTECIAFLQDPTLSSNLNQGSIETAFDLISIQYELKKQSMALIITEVTSDVFADSDLVLKVISPITSHGFVHDAIDFGVNRTLESLNIPDIVKSVNDTYGLFNPNLLLENPITQLIDTLPSMENAGLPITALQDQLVNILTDLGFELIAFVNE